MLILLTNVDQKSFETEFLIAICRLTDDKWQLKTLFSSDFDSHLSIFKSVFNCYLYSVCWTVKINLKKNLFDTGYQIRMALINLCW